MKGKRVLVTGADGFIGSHLVEALATQGADVRAFCLYNSQGSLGWLDDSKAKFEPRLGDIRDARFVEAACDGMEYVFHLAALIAIPYSYSAPESFLQTNVMGTLNVLEGVRRRGVKRLVHTSTSEVYGTPKVLPIRETHPLNAQSPYAASKVAADQLALSFHRSYETPVVVVRPFNTYGPRQSTRAVLPTILTQLISGKKELELGSLETRRDMTFVSDTVDGMIAAAEAPAALGEVIQLGTGKAVSIGEMVSACCKALNVEATVKQDPRRLRPAASEVQVLLSDPSRAKTELGWQAKVGLEEGLRRTADWLRAHMVKYPGSFLHV
jgi:NAD dependent epimerase/dehydratase